jgi:hypothetical protein
LKNVTGVGAKWSLASVDCCFQEPISKPQLDVSLEESLMASGAASQRYPNLQNLTLNQKGLTSGTDIVLTQAEMTRNNWV